MDKYGSFFCLTAVAACIIKRDTVQFQQRQYSIVAIGYRWIAAFWDIKRTSGNDTVVGKTERGTRMEKYVAVIAHDAKKADIVELAFQYKDVLKKFPLVGTGETGKRIETATGLAVKKMQPGPLGGDQQIGGMIAADEVIAVIFLRDPLTAQPHEPDVSAFLRLCDVHSIPVATNIASARILLTVLDKNIALFAKK